jgi:transposase
VPTGPGHPFHARLNELLAERGFDEFVEGLCAKFYHELLGRPGIPPGVYLRMLLTGYFEGIDSERGIAWRCADSLALRTFLGYALSESTPDPRRCRSSATASTSRLTRKSSRGCWRR